MKRYLVAPLVLALLAACGGDDDTGGAVPEDTRETSTTEAPATTGVAATSAAPTTTEAPTATEAPTTTAAPTTTTIPVGSDISRETALAANRCLDLWHNLQGDGQVLGFYLTSDMENTVAACDDAQAQLEVDEIGVPVGPYPIRELGLLLSKISLELSFSSLDMDLGQCRVYCDVPRRGRKRFLVLEDIIGVVPEAFRGTPLFVPTIEGIEGLTVRS
jgi:hypothetical protein